VSVYDEDKSLTSTNPRHEERLNALEHRSELALAQAKEQKTKSSGLVERAQPENPHSSLGL
jgi:hypothetical protein